jgi:hypothetical protein
MGDIRMRCDECDNEGYTDSEDEARALVHGHNERQHDGADVADWEEE